MLKIAVALLLLGLALAATTARRGSSDSLLSDDELSSFKEEKKELNKSCPKNAEWRECGPMCPEKACENVLKVSPCFSLRCGGPGCACKAGHVRASDNDKEGDCTPISACPQLKTNH
ncbi:unnamed protein product, partial [Mesorhabditis spiculigera]